MFVDGIGREPESFRDFFRFEVFVDQSQAFTLTLAQAVYLGAAHRRWITHRHVDKPFWLVPSDWDRTSIADVDERIAMFLCAVDRHNPGRNIDATGD